MVVLIWREDVVLWTIIIAVKYYLIRMDSLAGCEAAIGWDDHILRLGPPMTLLYYITTVSVMVAQVNRFVIKFDLGTELAIASLNQWLGKIDVLVTDIILVEMM